MTQEKESFWAKWLGAKKSPCCCGPQVVPDTEEPKADEHAAEGDPAKKKPEEETKNTPCC